MTVDDLIAEVARNRSGPSDADTLSPSNMGDFLRFALGHLLEDIDYEADRSASGAVAARVLAVLISCADEKTGRAVQ